MSRPEIGDRIEMPAMAGDVDIIVEHIYEDQPLLDTDDVLIIADQYGQDHLVEELGPGWQTVSSDALSDAGFDHWSNHCTSRSASAPKF